MLTMVRGPQRCMFWDDALIFMIFVGTNNSSSAPSEAEKENKSTDDDEKGEFKLACFIKILPVVELRGTLECHFWLYIKIQLIATVFCFAFQRTGLRSRY